MRPLPCALISFLSEVLALPDARGVFNSRRIASSFPDLCEASITELQKGLVDGDFTSVDLVNVGKISYICSRTALTNSSRHTLLG